MQSFDFSKPISDASAPDPFVMYHDGMYYAMYTEVSRLVLHRASQLSEVARGETKTVLSTGDKVFGNLWAPEMLHFGGRWYIYSSGSTRPDRSFDSIRMFCLESESDDPWSDYTFKAFTDPDIYAIDQTLFYSAARDKLYISFAQILPATGNTLVVAEMENPWTISNRRAIIHYAAFDWERGRGMVTEGPFFIERGGRLMLLYSANDTFSPFYCLGLLEYIGGDPVSKAAWKCHDKPYLTAHDGIFAPGHASVFRDRDGDYMLAYHGSASPDKYDRSMYILPFGFDENGYPSFTR